MNNSELVDRLEQYIATNRFSDARKLALSEFIGKQYRVSGVILRVTNTTGYLRRQSLRKGKTITLRLDDSENILSIRCTRARSIELVDQDPSTPFIMTVTITDYDEVRQLLQADQLGDINSGSIADEVALTAIDADKQSHAIASNENDQLLDEIQQMQLESQRRLSEVADDINKAQSRNVPLVHSKPDNQDTAESKEQAHHVFNEPAGKNLPAANTASEPESNPAIIDGDPNSESAENDQLPQSVEVATEQVPTVANPLSETATHAFQQSNDAEEETTISELDVTDDHETRTHTTRLDQLRRTILGDQQSPIEQKDFDQIVALETSVPIEKVKEIHRHLWHTVMSPSMFGEQREIFNFFPFGDFRLMRSRDVVNMDFKSAPVPQLAKHDAVEEYPHSNFDGSDTDSNHPPIATHAIRIAATVAPIVGLSPPVTYDVIFETLQLLLKVFGVGKRRVRFTDVGEFFPVLLRGTLQYHFRPYRPLIRFATESFRAIISLAEHEGDGQLAFKADKGVPDRTVGKREYSQPVDHPKKGKNTQLGCVILVLAFLGFRLVLYLFD
ncbi:MAG: hypothetical protein NZ807_04755 [Dehalococcoidia bacterium]|nr:hypothetical protein [Dehalococcoidia bacterium]